MRIEIPGHERWEPQYLVLDFDGTLTSGGLLFPSVVAPLRSLAQHLRIHVAAAHAGKYSPVATLFHNLDLYVEFINAQSGEEKMAHVAAIGAQRVVAIGSGASDAQMLHAARLGIAVIGEHGAAGTALQAADVVCNDIVDALGLLLDVRRLQAVLHQ
jgi:soluble P-type ATPase